MSDKKVEKAPIPIDAERQAEEEKAKRLQDLVSGKVDAPNEYAAFIIEKLRTCRMEKDQMKQRLEQGRAVVEMLERKLIELQAIHNNYADDLEKWDKPKGEGGSK